MSESDKERRRRWITFGELIALAALVVSAAGVWLNWKATSNRGPAQLVEQKQSIPLMLHGKVEDDGQRLEISPVEQSHALESLTIAIRGASPIEVGSDGELAASDVQSALKGHDKEAKDRRYELTAQVEAEYVEGGKERSARGTYKIGYKWEGGGLFGGRTLKLAGLSSA